MEFIGGMVGVLGAVYGTTVQLCIPHSPRIHKLKLKWGQNYLVIRLRKKKILRYIYTFDTGYQDFSIGN